MTAELREWVERAPRSHADGGSPHDGEECITGSPDALLAIADAIDAEHGRRMEQSRTDMRRAACRYMAAVVEDYKRGIKRRRQ